MPAPLPTGMAFECKSRREHHAKNILRGDFESGLARQRVFESITVAFELPYRNDGNPASSQDRPSSATRPWEKACRCRMLVERGRLTMWIATALFALFQVEERVAPAAERMPATDSPSSSSAARR